MVPSFHGSHDSAPIDGAIERQAKTKNPATNQTPRLIQDVVGRDIARHAR